MLNGNYSVIFFLILIIENKMFKVFLKYFGEII